MPEVIGSPLISWPFSVPLSADAGKDLEPSAFIITPD